MNKKLLYVILTILLVVTSIVVLTLYITSGTKTSTVILEYMVKAGDTCKKIAFEHNTSVESIVKLNDLTPECMIVVKQKLLLAVPAP